MSEGKRRAPLDFLSYRLAMVGQSLNRQAAELLARHGTTSLPEWRVLSILAMGEGMSSADLIRLTQMDPALVSRSLASLCRKGLAVSHRQTGNRRLVFNSLTDLGRSEYATVMPHVEKRQDALEAALTAEEKTALDRALTKLAAAELSLQTK